MYVDIVVLCTQFISSAAQMILSIQVSRQISLDDSTSTITPQSEQNIHTLEDLFCSSITRVYPIDRQHSREKDL